MDGDKSQTPISLTSAVAAVFCALAIVAQPATAADWSVTEIQLQYGNLETPSFFGGGDADTFSLTFQHASSWKYGDNYFFITYFNGDDPSGFNNNDVYGEFYPNFSLGKITGKNLSLGPMWDVGILLGLNFGADSNILKFLPGVRFSWTIPGFAFFNTDFMAYIDASEGIINGVGAPKETNSYIIDVNWAYLFTIGGSRFSIEGHIEYVGARENEFGDEVSWWILAQPEFRFDLGHALGRTQDHLFIGVELQIWKNKLGDKATDEFAPQALLVWRF